MLFYRVLQIIALSLSLPLQAKDLSFLSLDLDQSRYQSSNYTLIGADLNLESAGNKNLLAYKLNPIVQGTVETKGEQSELYFGVPEAYLKQSSLGPGFRLAVGRSLKHWSRLDEEFNIGIWQPQLRWDYLAPRQQGLTGIFFDWRFGPGVELTLFTSPISIPDQGPQFKLRGGQFSSSNPWFYRPQSRFQMFNASGINDDSAIYYEIDRPKNEELILHSSFGAAVKLSPGGPFWLQFAYAYKPMNQIHLGIECTSCVDLAALPMDITAKIHPMIVKHNVFTVESGFEQIDSKGFLSLTMDIPSPSGAPALWEESSLHSMLFMGSGFEHFVPGIVVPTWFRYSYMKAIEFKNRSEGGLLGDQVDSSLDRYPFREVAAFESRFRLRQVKSSQLNLKARYLYSVPEKGGWLNSGLEWAVNNTTWNLGFDIIGANIDANSSDAGLLSRYRGNDRITGGMSYVF